MKQHFLLLLFIIWTFGASVVEYHGNRRLWTTVDSAGKTYVALHILNQSVNLIFPSDKTFAQIASDIKVYSPSGNVTCQDTTNTLKFKLAFDDDDKKYIRGDVKVVIDQLEYVQMYMYEKCLSNERRDDYKTVIIEDTYKALESDGRTCFKDVDPFHSYGTGNAMSLGSTPNGFGCEVYMILPEYMHVEDEKLPKYTKLPLNTTIFGEHEEKFWWKSENDSMLPVEISFDSSKNVVINILNSKKDVPYFFRIGSGQPIPTFKFSFGAKCEHTKFELYLNLKPECQVISHLSENGFTVSTKRTSNIGFKGLPSSMIFDGKYVSVKVDSPLSIKALENCELSNDPDVPLDQFVLQIEPTEDVGGCEKAEIVLLNSDTNYGTEVLIDQSKLVESIDATTKSENNSTIASFLTTLKSFESAEFAWWWILVGGLLLVGIIGATIVFVIYIRRRRPQKKNLPPVESLVEDEEIGRIAIETKTALSPEKLSKEIKPKIGGKEKKEEPAKKKVPKEVADAKRNQKRQSAQPPKPIQTPKSKPPPQSAEPSKQQQPPPPLVRPKPLRNLKFCSMYGSDKETKLGEPFDYHENESSKFEPAIIRAKFVQPEFRVLTNFWDCLGEILTTKRFCPIYADNFDGGHTNVFFMVRDLVSNEKYLPLRCLSNRMLEDFEPPQKKSPFVFEDGQERIKTDWYYCLRVFILSYDPLTVEIHCRGPWPHFIFNVGECPRCFDLYRGLVANDWKNSPTACDEDWDTFVCRVKRTPYNTHQFLSYYGGAGVDEPENPNEINNIFVLRGQWKFDHLRECSRGCFVPTNKSHLLNFDFETRLQHSQTSSK